MSLGAAERVLQKAPHSPHHHSSSVVVLVCMVLFIMLFRLLPPTPLCRRVVHSYTRIDKLPLEASAAVAAEAVVAAAHTRHGKQVRDAAGAAEYNVLVSFTEDVFTKDVYHGAGGVADYK